jgi:hypothetical protein
MEGMAHAAARQHELAISTAWHTAVFALTGYSGKLKELSEYVGKTETWPEDDERLENARLIHFFNSLKAKGYDIKTERVVH